MSDWSATATSSSTSWPRSRVNIFMAEEFSDWCDGFCIGSNDLTQLTMGADRDSDVLGKMGYFDERNEAIKRAIKILIDAAHKKGGPVGICGQAPSVYPEFCEFLVKAGIDTISLNPDTVMETISIIASAEQRLLLEAARKINGAVSPIFPNLLGDPVLDLLSPRPSGTGWLSPSGGGGSLR